jgi:hypothetical protein
MQMKRMKKKQKKRNLFLFWSMIKYRTSILRSPITTLSIEGCGVVKLKEKLDQIRVFGSVVIFDLQHFRMSCFAGANFLIGWILFGASQITHCAVQQVRKFLLHCEQKLRILKTEQT